MQLVSVTARGVGLCVWGQFSGSISGQEWGEVQTSLNSGARPGAGQQPCPGGQGTPACGAGCSGAAARGARSDPAPSQQRCGAVPEPWAPRGAGRAQGLPTATTRPVSVGDQTEAGGTWRGLC